MLRTFTALLLALCFGLYTAEALLADVHDDDATHGELMQIDGAKRHAASHAAHGDDAQTVSTVSTFATRGGPSVVEDHHPGERPAGESEHGEHACHHAHVHVGLRCAATVSVPLAALPAGSPCAENDREPTSRVIAPQFRPPIA